MYIIRALDEFKKALLNPNPNEIYALVPADYDVLSDKAERILKEQMDCLVYGDVEIHDGKNSILKFNPSFDIPVLTKGFSLTSPVFVRVSRPIPLQSEEFNQLVIELLHHIVGIHVPEPIFRWRQNFFTGQAKEINTP